MSNIEFQFARVKTEKNKVLVHPLLYSSFEELCQKHVYDYDGFIMRDVEIQLSEEGIRLFGRKIKFAEVFKTLDENGIPFIAMSMRSENYSYISMEEVIKKMKELFYTNEFRMFFQDTKCEFRNWRFKKIPVTSFRYRFEDEKTKDWIWSKYSFPLKQNNFQELTIHASDYLIIH